MMTLMRRAFRAGLIFLGVAAVAAAQTAPPLDLPHTLAGKKFTAFLQAFNSGDREQARKFIASNYSREALAAHDAEFRAGLYADYFRASGGFDLVQMERSEEYELAVLARARRFGDWCRITLSAERKLPYGLRGMTFEWIVPPPGSAAHGKLTDEQVAAELDTYMNALAAADLFRGVVLVARGPRPFFEKAYGTYGDPPQPIPTESRFGLASIGKSFTAVCIAQLAEAGKLRYDDPITRFFPDLPRRTAGRITVHMLLTHTAGLAGFLDAPWFRAHPVHSEEEYVPLVLQEALIAEPGAKFSYSNGGYMVLAGLVEKLTGQTYADYVRTHILKPAEMGLPGVNSASARDLLRFSVALQDGRLVRPETRDLLLSPKIATDTGSEYGYGFEIEDVNGQRIAGHAGGGPGVDDRFDMYLGAGLTSVVMSSRPGDYAQRVTARIRTLLTQK